MFPSRTALFFALLATTSLAVTPVTRAGDGSGRGDALDAGVLAERLAAAVRFETVSPQDPADFRAEPFIGLNAHLRATYSRTYTTLRVERVSQHSLLLEWPGSDPTLAPALFMSHTDVVPIEPGTEAGWTYPPFAGTVADGFVWGRGTLDVKNGVIAYHEAVEALLADGFTPRRTLFFAFGHDEEIGGRNGAGVIAETLRERGIHFEFAIDEGGFLLEDFPQLEDRDVAMIGVAEKTYFTVHLTARGLGGHSSIPPRVTAVGRLTAALHRLDTQRMAPRLCEPARQQLEHMAPALSGTAGFALGNLWLTAPLVVRDLASERETNPLVRTTTALTMVSAGVKENVVPQEASATVNFRILPCETTDDVLDHVRSTIADDDILVEADGWSEAARPGRLDTRAWKLLTESILESYPEALVLPGQLSGATDTRHYADLADDIYRFIGVQVPMSDIGGAHGTDERVGMESYARSVAIAMTTLRRAAE